MRLMQKEQKKEWATKQNYDALENEYQKYVRKYNHTLKSMLTLVQKYDILKL